MAVYTKVSEPEAQNLLRAYDIGELRELVGIKQGIQNTNYILYTTQARYILTLYEPRYIREDDLPFFLNLMDHLAKKGSPCPLPVARRDGQLLSRVAGRPAAIIQFLNGKAPSHITPDDCAGLGRALAAMHNASADFTMKRPNPLSLAAWNEHLKACKPRADELMAGLGDILQQELDVLHAQWPKGLPSGVIHADLFPDNVFFGDEASCDMFDFYYACNDFLAYDLAICFNAWCFESHTAFNITKARALIKGYREVRPLSPEELQALPLLARGAAMRFLLTRLYDWLNQAPGALVKVKDPLEYLTRLQFHQMVTDIDAYGLEA